MHIPSRHPSTRPFMAAPRTQFYHPATLIDAALKGIERCIRRAEGVALVVGPPGTGKSLLLAKVASPWTPQRLQRWRGARRHGSGCSSGRSRRLGCPENGQS